jgi:hypothetical protein
MFFGILLTVATVALAQIYEAYVGFDAHRSEPERADVRLEAVNSVLWLLRETGKHAIARIWHEAPPLYRHTAPVTKVGCGTRECVPAGVVVNNSASAVHLSNCGAALFGDEYARHVAVTPVTVPPEPPGTWFVVAFSFDNGRNSVTACRDGKGRASTI